MKSISVLVIDDDEVMTFLFGKALTTKDVNCEFKTVITAEEGLKYLETTAKFPDVVLVDYRLPKMDGFDFLLEYEKRKYPEQHQALVFMISAYSKKDMLKPLQEFPFVEGFMEKPVTPNKLREMLISYFPEAALNPTN